MDPDPIPEPTGQEPTERERARRAAVLGGLLGLVLVLLGRRSRTSS